mgnify:CR=1 FL=1
MQAQAVKSPSLPKSFKQTIPSAAYELEMTLVPGDDSKKMHAFYMSTTEVTWEAFDVFVFGLDGTDTDAKPATGKPADAVSRPSKPYIPPDRGFGHEGFAAICVSAKSAEEFCKWLSVKSGRGYRLATEDEWEYAARGGAETRYPWGDDAVRSREFAWTDANSEGTTHAARTKQPNGYGLYDMIGNAREWVEGRDGQPVLKGGGYRDGAESCTVSARWPFEKTWQATDPQIPKSKWWLSDGSFIGLRIVCEAVGTAVVPAGDPLAPMKQAPGQPKPGEETPTAPAKPKETGK